MATPELTDQQRKDALEKATKVRSARKVFKDQVSRGEFSLEEAIRRAKADEALAGIRVRDLLQCFQGVGPKRAAGVMEEVGISSARRIRGLGAHQVHDLLARENT